MNNSKLISNRYLIIKHIGKGGMADVYIAVDTILKREVAIKILKDDLSNDEVSLERFRREANASTCLSHPNIVDIYDVGDDGEDHYIVMEYIKGQSLKELIKKRGPLPYKEAVSIMKQLCGAIMEAHRNGIIHRDIKSQNVLIKDDGMAKVVDFGIALASNAMQITSEDAILGSVHYMAPELAKGEMANMQSDIYSLGIVFYELLCADVPFRGDSAVNVILNSTKNPLPNIKNINPNIPQSIINIILKATAKNRLNRYQNVAEMLSDINACLLESHANDIPYTFAHNEDIYVKKEEAKAKPKKQNHFHILLMILSGIVALLVVLILLFFSGILDFNKKVVVPNLDRMTILEASDALDEVGLILDMSSIKRELTDNVEAGLIIEYNPVSGQEVEKGSSIRVVVSDGKYAVMDNFVGMMIDEATNLIKQKYPNVIIDSVAVDSNEKAGQIVAQEGLKPEDKFDPNKNPHITLEYSDYKTLILPHNIVGSTVSEAKAILDDLKVPYELKELDPFEYNLNHLDIMKLSLNTIYDMNPKSGTSFSPNSGKVTLIYVSENVFKNAGIEIGEQDES